jgi:hypothetical protein
MKTITVRPWAFMLPWLLLSVLIPCAYETRRYTRQLEDLLQRSIQQTTTVIALAQERRDMVERALQPSRCKTLVL